MTHLPRQDDAGAAPFQDAETLDVDLSRAGPLSTPAPGPVTAESCPERIGAYRILRELGAGGMGIVYLGVNDADVIKRRVAIKLLKRGMDTEDILRRFKLERQFLAAMNHPGIARLFDAGETPDGRPYFVMEYVEGLDLLEYCDTNRLGIDQRLDLFEKVCAAVHHAHQALIVHRDIKPSNIVVTGEGQPKLLDFGIAKVTNPDYALAVGDPTAATVRLMTPEYASPEQVRGQTITTASDIYSLGVLLYELLSGHRPYKLRQRVGAEVEKVVCELDPERPSTAISRSEDLPAGRDSTIVSVTPETVSRTRSEARVDRLRRRLAGDIDNIVLMAMRKEPQRRYKSAEQLAEDISRHRRGMPVIARPDTIGYRTTKFVRRHRTGVAVASIFLLVLTGGFVGTATGWDAATEQRNEAVEQKTVAESQRDRAERRFREVRELARVFMYDFHDAIQTLDGSVPAREMLVTTALKYLDGLAREATDDPELRRELAAAYERVGDIRGGIRNPSLGDLDGALESYRAALEIRSALAQAQPADGDRQRELAGAHMRIGDVRMEKGDAPGALETHRAALMISERLVESSPTSDQARDDLAVSLLNVGAALVGTGNAAEAKALYERSLEIRRERAAEHPGDVELARDVSVACLRIGGRLADAGSPQDALPQYEEAMRIRARLSAGDPSSSRARRDLAVAQYFVGSTLMDLGRADEAAPHMDAYLQSSAQRARDNPQSARAQRDLASAHESMARMYTMLERWPQVVESARDATRVSLELTRLEPANLQYRLLAAAGHRAAARGLSGTGDSAAAIAEAEAAVSITEGLLRDGGDVRHRAAAGESHLELASLLAGTGDVSQARTHLERGQEIFLSAVNADGTDAAARRGLTSTLLELSAMLAQLNDRPGALARAEEALRIAPPEDAATARRVAFALHIAGNSAAAAARARAAIKLLDGQMGPEAAALRDGLEADIALYEKKP